MSAIGRRGPGAIVSPPRTPGSAGVKLCPGPAGGSARGRSAASPPFLKVQILSEPIALPAMHPDRTPWIKGRQASPERVHAESLAWLGKGKPAKAPGLRPARPRWLPNNSLEPTRMASLACAVEAS